MSTELTALLVGTLGAMFSAFLVALLLRTPVHRLFVDKPDARKIHQEPVARAGGIGFLLAFAGIVVLGGGAAALSGLNLEHVVVRTVMVAAAVVFVVGVLDDSVLVEVRVRHKLVAEFVLALVVVFGFGVHFGRIAVYPGVSLPEWVGIGLSVVWIVGVMNAVNIIDGIDGLAGGVALICFVAIGVLASFNGLASHALLCALLAGVCFGFLVYNFSPARIFMGDTGALFLGVSLAILATDVTVQSRGQPSIVVASLLVGLPILDVFVAMVRRFFRSLDRRENWLDALKGMTVADNSHMHHRLVYQGLSHGQTCMLIYLLAASMGVAAIGITELPLGVSIVILVYLAGFLVLILDRYDFGGRFRRMVGLRQREWVARSRHTSVVGVLGADGRMARYIAEYDGAEVSFLSLHGSSMAAAARKPNALLVFVPAGVPDDGVERTLQSIGVPGDKPILVVRDDEAPDQSGHVPLKKGGEAFVVSRPKSVYVLVGMLRAIAADASRVDEPWERRDAAD